VRACRATQCMHTNVPRPRVCGTQGLPEEERAALLWDAAKFVTEHLFGPNSPAGKVRLLLLS
jgi:hypothetical protein